MSRILIEVCCGSTDDAVEAEKGGAARVKLTAFGGTFFRHGFTQPDLWPEPKKDMEPQIPQIKE